MRKHFTPSFTIRPPLSIGFLKTKLRVFMNTNAKVPSKLFRSKVFFQKNKLLDFEMSIKRNLKVWYGFETI